MKNAPKFSPKFLSLYLVGRKKSRKIPAKFPAKFPSPKIKKKNSPTSFCRGAGSTKGGAEEHRKERSRVKLQTARRVFRVSWVALLLHSRAAKRGGFKRGGFPIWTCPSFFVLFCPFWDFPDFSGIFPICSGMVRGFPDLSFSSFSAFSEHLRGTVPKGSATQSGPFPKKMGNTRVWKPPRLVSLSSCCFPHPPVVNEFLCFWL